MIWNIMAAPEAVLAEGYTSFDSGLRTAAAFSGRLAYLCMCLTLCWGVLVATGWVRRVTGHQALRTGHVMLASCTFATATVHGFSMLFLDEQLVVGTQVVIPLLNGYVRHALGIIAYDLMVMIIISAGLHRFFRYRAWLRFHQTAYVAIALGVAHSWWGAWSNASINAVWIAGLTVLTPALVLATIRFLPTGALVRIGLLAEATPVSPKRIDKALPLQISVDNQRCHRYGFCQSEAPSLFQLREDGRLAYRQAPEVSENLEVLSAARSCPMRAIQLEARKHD